MSQPGPPLPLPAWHIARTHGAHRWSFCGREISAGWGHYYSLNEALGIGGQLRPLPSRPDVCPECLELAQAADTVSALELDSLTQLLNNLQRAANQGMVTPEELQRALAELAPKT